MRHGRQVKSSCPCANPCASPPLGASLRLHSAVESLTQTTDLQNFAALSPGDCGDWGGGDVLTFGEAASQCTETGLTLTRPTPWTASVFRFMSMR